MTETPDPELEDAEPADDEPIEPETDGPAAGPGESQDPEASA